MRAEYVTTVQFILDLGGLKPTCQCVKVTDFRDLEEIYIVYNNKNVTVANYCYSCSTVSGLGGKPCTILGYF